MQFTSQLFRRFARFATSLALFALALSSQATAQESAPDDEILGTVGELEVRMSDLRDSLASLTPEENAALRNDPTALGQYVRALLVQQLVLREAIEAEWDKSAVVAERMKVLREGVVANTWLESAGAPPADFPNEEQLSAAYQARLESFLEPKSWQLAQIFVSSPKSEDETSDPEAEAKVKRISDSLKEDPGKFGVLAASESDEPSSAAQQGEIGWLPEPRIHPSIRAALTELELGEISEPVRMDDGWHFIKVLDIREAYIPTLQQIREPLAKLLRAEQTQLAREAYLRELLREKPIAINELVLSKLIVDDNP